MIVNFLAAADGTPLTKTYQLSFGSLVKSPYPNVRDFSSFPTEVNTPADFHAAITVHAAAGHCLLKGNLLRDLNGESRQGATDPNGNTRWIVFDLDHVPGVTSADEFISSVLPAEFQDVTYVLQYSSSYGFSDDTELRAHIFFLLSHEVTAPLLKQWMKRLNLVSAAMLQNTRLAEGGCTLKWPVDISVNQNDKLIYISPPRCLDGAVDPVPQHERIQLIQKTHDLVTLNLDNLNAEAIKVAERNRVDALRKEAGLEKRKIKYDNSGTVQVVLNPDQMTLLGAPFEERGYVYLPISPKNRYTFYHPVGNHELLYTFRDPETAYPMAEVLPSYYWGQERKKRAEKLNTQTILAFRDGRSDTKYIGQYDEANQVSNFCRIKAREDIADFYKQHHASPPEIIPTWTFEFDPTTTKQVDPHTCWLNKFSPSIYMLTGKKDTPTFVPPRVEQLLRHVMAGDDECYHHFINWLAYKFQTRKKCKTAWFFQGVEGTGKGLLYNKLLRPLFGSNHCHIKRMDALLDKFNAELETSLLWAIDEANIEDFKEDGQIVEKLKNMITEDQQVIRAMHTNPYNATNFTDFILFSNATLAIKLSPTDRRYNICPRQNTPLLSVMSRTDIENLEDDLPMFAAHLMTVEADAAKAAQPLSNTAKAELIAVSRTTHEEFLYNLMAGNLDYFVASVIESPDIAYIRYYQSAKDTVNIWLRNRSVGQVSIDEVCAVYNYIISGARQPMTPVKLIRMLAMRGVPMHQEGRRRSLPVTWKDVDPQLMAEWTSIGGAQPLTVVK